MRRASSRAEPKVKVPDAIVQWDIELIRNSNGGFYGLSICRDGTIILPLLLEFRGFPLELGRLGHVNWKLTKAPEPGQNSLSPYF